MSFSVSYSVLLKRLFLSFQAHEKAQNAALQYQRAVSMFRAAKETISIAEEASMQGATKKRDFDSALQELLNHATIKVNNQTNIGSMLCTCDTHVVCIWYPCDVHVILMWCACDTHHAHLGLVVDVIPFGVHVIPMWCTLDIHWCACDYVVCMWYPCDVWIKLHARDHQEAGFRLSFARIAQPCDNKGKQLTNIGSMWCAFWYPCGVGVHAIPIWCTCDTYAECVWYPSGI